MAGRKKLYISLLAVFFAGAGHSEEAADTGGSVVLVYNSSMPVSKEVADHYATQRQVPAGQIFGFDLPQGETISREDFASKLQQPLWNEMRSRNLLTYSRTEDG